MVGGQGLIGLEDLPEDFLDEQVGADIAPQYAPDSDPAEGTPVAVAAAPSPVQGLTVSESNASPELPSTSDGAGSLEDVALAAMAQMLRLHKGNVSAAAKALGVSRNTVYRRKEQLPADVWG